jgi:hypothetical protein
MGSKLVNRKYVYHFMGEAHLSTCKHLAPVSRNKHHTSVTKIIIMDISSSTVPVTSIITANLCFLRMSLACSDLPLILREIC